MLNNALAQTGWPGAPLTPDTWRTVVRQRVAALPWDQVVADVHPFLEPAADVHLLTRETLLDLLR
jgi:hypothetical protein